MKAALLAVFLALPLAAQTKPELTSTEKMALQSLLDKGASNQKVRDNLDASDKQLLADAALIQADAAKTHPGYHLTLKPIELVKDETKPEVKK